MIVHSCSQKGLTSPVKTAIIRGLILVLNLEITLANSLSARIRARQAEKHRLRNASQRSAMRTAIKKVTGAIEAGDKSAAEAAYKAAVPFIDKSAGKGLIHQNKAARHKSRLNTAIRAL
jgi:small subunit ribosomal protein S20